MNSMNSFSKLDLIVGAFGIRAIRKYRSFCNSPDMEFVKENLSFGGFTSYSELEKKGITAILDLRAEVPEEKIFKSKLRYKKIRVTDSGIPSSSQITQIIDWIRGYLDSKEKVFVHCNLGRGRASLAIALYFIHEGFSLESSLKIIKKRKFIYLNKKQLDFLKNYHLTRNRGNNKRVSQD